MKPLLILLSFLLSVQRLTAQEKDSVICNGLPRVEIWATLPSCPFSKESLRLHKDSISKGFTIVLSDRNYKLIGFRAYFDKDNGDVYYRDILGSTVTPENYPALKGAKAGDLFRIECITIRNTNQRFLARPFHFFITE